MAAEKTKDFESWAHWAYISFTLFINKHKETETRNKGDKKIQNLDSFLSFLVLSRKPNIGFNENTKRRRNPCLKNKRTNILSPVWLPRKPEKSEEKKNPTSSFFIIKKSHLRQHLFISPSSKKSMIRNWKLRVIVIENFWVWERKQRDKTRRGLKT